VFLWDSFKTVVCQRGGGTGDIRTYGSTVCMYDTERVRSVLNST
jgi:hypothetical protein